MNSTKLPTWKSGDPFAAAPFNALSRGITAALGLRVDPASGVRLQSDSRGHRLSRTRPRAVWGLLAGAGSPYTFTETIDDGAGGWTPGTRTGTAYEVNGIAGLAGQRERLVPDRVGAWRFQRVTSGVAAVYRICRTAITSCIPSTGLNGTITVSSGGTVVTATAVGTGAACVTVSGPGTYTVVTSGPACHSNTETVTFVYPGTNSATVRLGPQTGWGCCGGEIVRSRVLHLSNTGFMGSLTSAGANYCSWQFTPGLGAIWQLDYLGGGNFQLDYNPSGRGICGHCIVSHAGDINAINILFLSVNVVCDDTAHTGFCSGGASYGDSTVSE